MAMYEDEAAPPKHAPPRPLPGEHDAEDVSTKHPPNASHGRTTSRAPAPLSGQSGMSNDTRTPLSRRPHTFRAHSGHRDENTNQSSEAFGYHPSVIWTWNALMRHTSAAVRWRVPLVHAIAKNTFWCRTRNFARVFPGIYHSTHLLSNTLHTVATVCSKSYRSAPCGWMCAPRPFRIFPSGSFAILCNSRRSTGTPRALWSALRTCAPLSSGTWSNANAKLRWTNVGHLRRRSPSETSFEHHSQGGRRGGVDEIREDYSKIDRCCTAHCQRCAGIGRNRPRSAQLQSSFVDLGRPKPSLVRLFEQL